MVGVVGSGLLGHVAGRHAGRRRPPVGVVGVEVRGPARIDDAENFARRVVGGGDRAIAADPGFLGLPVIGVVSVLDDVIVGVGGLDQVARRIVNVCSGGVRAAAERHREVRHAGGAVERIVGVLGGIVVRVGDREGVAQRVVRGDGGVAGRAGSAIAVRVGGGLADHAVQSVVSSPTGVIVRVGGAGGVAIGVVSVRGGRLAVGCVAVLVRAPDVWLDLRGLAAEVVVDVHGRAKEH